MHDPHVCEYVTMEGDCLTLPQRWWTAESLNTLLPPSSPYKLRCKPDIVLTNFIDNKTTLLQSKRNPWSNVLALCEMSKTNLRDSAFMAGTLQEKLYIMQMEQDNHCFTPAICFVGDMFTLHVFYHDGLQTFNTKIADDSSPKKLLKILGSLFFGHPSTIGYDDTMICKDGRVAKIAQNGEWWKVQKQLHKLDPFVGAQIVGLCWEVQKHWS